jgi:hypothetical protein
MSKETNPFSMETLDDEGINYYSWRPQAEIFLDAAGLGLDYASAIKFKKKNHTHAAARLKTFGTICKLMGQNHATSTLRDFTSIHSSHKKSPDKLWKYLQHRFSGPGNIKVKAPPAVHQPRLIMNFVDDIDFITESFVPNEILYEPQRSLSALHDDLEWHSASMPELISASDSSSDDEE